MDTCTHVCTSGLVGDLQHSVAEIGWANLYITQKRGRVIDYSDWYAVEEACFVFKQPKPLSDIYTLIFPFGRYVWSLFFISLTGIANFYLIHSLAWTQRLVTQQSSPL